MESILQTIKKMLGISPDNSDFDTDLIVFINSVFLILNQIGVGTDHTFSISGPNNTWSEFTGAVSDEEALKTYIYLRVRMLFDPPSSSSLMEALKASAAEYEWRLNTKAELID